LVARSNEASSEQLLPGNWWERGRHYETILFKTFLEYKTVAAERVILTKESRRWKVIEYRVY